MTDEPATDEHRATSEGGVDDAGIRVLLTRLARPHPSGGHSIERAAVLAAGADFTVAMAWIEAHGGEPEAPVVARAPRGLHSARLSAPAAGGATPTRFILPAAALAGDRPPPG